MQASEDVEGEGVAKRKLLSGLVLDRELSPRAVEPYHVRELVEALRSGASLPPLVIERETSRVVDGFHRVEAYREVYGREALIEVLEKDYADDAERFLDGLRYNASHGRRLSRFEQLKALEISQRISVDPKRLAGALSVRPAVVETLLAERFGSEITTRTPVPLKRTIEHMKGRPLTKEQVEVNRKLGGQPQSFYVNQLIFLVENNLLDTEDARLLEQLGRLKELLEGVETPAKAG